MRSLVGGLGPMGQEISGAPWGPRGRRPQAPSLASRRGSGL